MISSDRSIKITEHWVIVESRFGLHMLYRCTGDWRVINSSVTVDEFYILELLFSN